MGALDGRVAIITGAGRGLGREHALLFAAEGAKVVVNDLGGDSHGEGADATPAQQTVADIVAAGGEAVVNGDNVADWDGAGRLVRQADRHLRRPARAREQRRHPARPGDHQHDRGRVGRGDRGAPEGPLLPDPPRRDLLARADEGRQGGAGLDHPHVVDVGAVQQPRARPTTTAPSRGSRPSRRCARRSSCATACAATRSRPAPAPGSRSRRPGSATR